MDDNKDKPAFPFVYNEKDFDEAAFGGLTKREYFAAMALQGWVGGVYKATDPENAAKYSVEYADALLKELGK